MDLLTFYFIASYICLGIAGVTFVACMADAYMTYKRTKEAEKK